MTAITILLVSYIIPAMILEMKAVLFIHESQTQIILENESQLESFLSSTRAKRVLNYGCVGPLNFN